MSSAGLVHPLLPNDAHHGHIEAEHGREVPWKRLVALLASSRSLQRPFLIDSASISFSFWASGSNFDTPFTCSLRQNLSQSKSQELLKSACRSSQIGLRPPNLERTLHLLIATSKAKGNIELYCISIFISRINDVQRRVCISSMFESMQRTSFCLLVFPLPGLLLFRSFFGLLLGIEIDRERL